MLNIRLYHFNRRHFCFIVFLFFYIDVILYIINIFNIICASVYMFNKVYVGVVARSSSRPNIYSSVAEDKLRVEGDRMPRAPRPNHSPALDPEDLRSRPDSGLSATAVTASHVSPRGALGAAVASTSAVSAA
ncbi:hypothetical protein JYU34_022500 [Plutella xylostella]|uniref:Uncharacterized protein n=1 Tax=Plutella xylostella TaxID=51655 RepID=A0ABQ7PPY0_PLUXY|nr:hypothetical protein JYU34_022500 [Plutella xylostella]